MFRTARSFAGLALLGVIAWTASGSAQNLPDPSHLWALVVGISGYANAEPLRYAASDAISIAEFLKSPRGGSFREDRVITLTEDRASRFGIFAEIEQLQDKVQDGDMVVIFLAGHGYVNRRGIGYFIPSDGDLRMPAPTSIPFTALKELIELGLSHVQFRALMTDLCHSGRLGPEKSELSQKIQNLINENLMKLDGGSGGFLNLLASRPTEPSWEMDDLGSGVFTHSLLEALNGAAAESATDEITADEVVSYVEEAVPRYTSNQQHPMSNRSFDPERALSYPSLPGPQPIEDPRVSVSVWVPPLCPYSRVEWDDPVSGAITVQQIQNSATRLNLGPLAPGQYEFRFLGGEGASLVIRREVGGSGVEIDLADPEADRGFPGARNQFVSLEPPFPRTLSSLLQGPSPAPARSASLMVNLPAQTRILLDGSYLTNAGSRGLVRLTGLTPGVHRIYLEPSANREYRYRLQLREGLQQLDWRTGQIRPLAELPRLPSLRSIQDGVPEASHALLQSFQERLWDENLIGTGGESAVEILARLESGGLPEADAQLLRRELLVAMGDRAQRIILRYLEGGDLHWIPEVFEEGADLISQVQAGLKANPVLESQEHFFRGRALLERDDFEGAENELTIAIDLDPEASHAFNALGLALWRQQRLDEAIQPLTRALELSPQWNYPRITLALIDVELRQYGEAERLFQEALTVDPEDSSAFHGLGQLLTLSGRWDEAENRFRQALEFSPGNAYACHSLARLYLEQFRFEEAETLLRLSIRLVPEEREFRLTLAELLRRTGRLAEADGIFRPLLEASSGDASLLLAWAEHLSTSGRFDQGVPVVEKALQRIGRQSNLLVRAGLFWRDRDRNHSDRYFLRAIEIDPSNPYAHYNLAVNRLEAGRPGDAIRQIEDSIKGDSRYVPPRLLLSRIFAARGDYGEAWTAIRKAQELVFEAEQRHAVEEVAVKIRNHLVNTRVEEIHRQLERNRISTAWSKLCATLEEFGDSQDLRDLALEILADPKNEVNYSELPVGSLRAVLTSPFWIGLRDAERLWVNGTRDRASSTFLSILSQIQPRSPVLLTSFNLGNTRYSVHASVCLWIDRALESSDYGLARTLLDTAFQKNIFAAVPDFTPLTIDSLMVPDNEPIQEAFSDYEVARHPDIRAHRLLALVQAGTGADSNSITETLAALESEFPALGLRIEVARMLVAQDRIAEALNVLSGGLGGIPDSVPQENYSGLKEAVLFYADLSSKLGDPRPAVRFIEEARRILPNDADLRRKEETLRGMLP